MRFSTIAVVALSGFAAAQSTIPECAQKCLADATASVTSCSATDIACQCTTANKAAIQGAATPCVLQACPDPIAVLTAANADCAAVGGTASTPPISEETNTVTSVVDTATVTGTISISIISATEISVSTSTLSEESSTSIEAPTGTPSPRPSTNATVVTNSTATVSTTAVVVVGTSSIATTRAASSTTAAASTVPTGGAVKMVAGSVGGVLAFGLALMAGL